MKHLYIKTGLFVVALFLFITQMSNAFSLTIYFGSNDPGFGKNCTGRGFCKIEVVLFSAAGTSNETNAEGTIDGHHLMISFTKPIPESALIKRGRKSIVKIENEVICSIDNKTPADFRYKMIKVLKGEYEVDYSKNKNGDVAVKASYDLKKATR